MAFRSSAGAFVKKGEENGHPPIFLYSKNDIFVKRGEENGHPLIFLYTSCVRHQKIQKNKRKGGVRRPPYDKRDREEVGPPADFLPSILP